MAAKRTTAKKPGRAPAKKRTPRRAEAKTTGIEPAESVSVDLATLGDLPQRIEREGGVILAAYREPLGGHPIVLAMLPIDRVAPTPFQRDLSEAHAKRLAEVIHKTGRFLDPVVAITAPGRDADAFGAAGRDADSSGAARSGFWTPNGRHRLEAMTRLGSKSITALVVPTREIAWQILALNTEKAHNLKERALEVVRIYRGLLDESPDHAESEFAFYLEDPSLVTIGVCYERNPRFAGGAYHPVLRRVETFSDEPIDRVIATHERLADLTLDVETQVASVIDRLKERGLTSPYLRSFVVARINPLRWVKGEPPSAEDVLATMRDRAARFDVEKIRQQDIARAVGAPDDG